MPPVAAQAPPESVALRAERDVLRIRVQELEAQRGRLLNVVLYFRQKARLELAEAEAQAALALQYAAEPPVVNGGGARGAP